MEGKFYCESSEIPKENLPKGCLKIRRGVFGRESCEVSGIARRDDSHRKGCPAPLRTRIASLSRGGSAGNAAPTAGGDHGGGWL